MGGQPEGYPFDAHHYPLMRILVAAKARGLQAIDGPYAKIHDTDGCAPPRPAPPRSATTASGCCTRPRWTSSTRRSRRRPADYARATRILDAYERATSVERRGAVMLDGEMIDEASRKLALAIVAKGQPPA